MSSGSPSSSSLNPESSSNEPLYQVKLLSALRSGDPALIHPFLTEIGKDRRKSSEGDFDTGAAALHLAIRCGSVETIALLLSHRAISPNGVHPPGSGTTALHLAASLGRVDVVNLLLEQESIDDTKRDIQGRECKDVARGKEVVRAIEDSRSFLNASYRSLFRSYTLSPPNEQPSPLLIQLLQSPRVQFVNLSYLEDGSGLALLHEAAKRKDLRLIELAVRAGADVFVRNRKGKTAYEGSGKDDRVRVFLRQYANHDTTLIQSQTPLSEPPSLRGYLNKYTNVAKGYNTRWFVLNQGVLSYYRHQEDETIASRGSISMRTCVLKTSTSSDQMRFEVHSTPSRGHQSIQKWYMKANHPVEASRWVQAIQKNVDWYRREGFVGVSNGGGGAGGSASGGGDTDGGVRRPSAESDQSGVAMSVHQLPNPTPNQTQTMGRRAGTSARPTTSSGISSSATSNDLAKAATAGKAHKSSVSVSTGTMLSRRGTKGAAPATATTSELALGMGSYPGSLTDLGSSGVNEMGYMTTGSGGSNGGSPTRSQHHTSHHRQTNQHSGEDADDEHGHGPNHGGGPGGGYSGGGSSSYLGHVDDDMSEDSVGDKDVPSLGSVELAGNSIAAQVELMGRLVEGLVVPFESPSQSSSSSSGSLNANPNANATVNGVNTLARAGITPSPSSSSSTAPSPQHIQALKDSLIVVQTTLTEYTQMVRQRDDSWRSKMEKERRRQGVWEESLRVVVKEGEELEKELRRRSRKRGSRLFSGDLVVVPEGVGVGGGAAAASNAGAENVHPGREGSWDMMQSTVKQRRGTAPTPLVVTAPSPSNPPLQSVVVVSANNEAGRMKVPGVVITQPTPTTATGMSSFSMAIPIPRQGAGGAASTSARATPTANVGVKGAQGGSQGAATAEDGEEMDTDEEDEFFDAIESGNLPNLMVSDALVSMSPRNSAFVTSSGCEDDDDHQGGEGLPSYDASTAYGGGGLVVGSSSSNVDPKSLMASSLSASASASSTSSSIPSLPLPSLSLLDPYIPYMHPRTRLDLHDERPSVSLWSVLKNSIGKDLTKISFPVFFNEPTSMLQRMAEDMEFSECLDAAAKERDPLRRIAYVGAFAMSNYSSTIGRIAKPFNPMLSETFEYVRFDRQYCYLSEQVSHHPPISACWAESPTWHYYGEVDAQNKFMGKSFEIRPTGIAHADLLIPAAWGPKYPKANERGGEGKVVEHYSWKKVTTNVSGFILGSPTIDHYGDMVVTNHRTGDQCILTFKPRGWRGKDAFEISGQVLEASGKVAYEIAGRWNSQLVARQVGKGSGFLNPDINLPSSSSSSSSAQQQLYQPEYILLWRNSDKTPGSPFNLTPFAISLNACPPTLKPYLCPTDCRLRPDQRAFELGKYELANDLKGMQEEKQRGIRKRREEGVVKEHRPRWFMPKTDGDTGERVWAPVRVGGQGGAGGVEEEGRLEYWVERERVWKEGAVKWKDVDPIFIEEPQEIAR
ncbi:hypothetical protein BDN72DRAFT_827523 [Pluteus cervinus]|uniref:Uncharacterized protein n=1 Tax=Pluteus cervinus TaxID=181527 RepID=A0ACD3A9U9_9AGAR|nr:hypothetical protein BDN72DRAFT_827523 [Pluteus cervinus]